MYIRIILDNGNVDTELLLKIGVPDMEISDGEVRPVVSILADRTKTDSRPFGFHYTQPISRLVEQLDRHFGREPPVTDCFAIV